MREVALPLHELNNDALRPSGDEGREVGQQNLCAAPQSLVYYKVNDIRVSGDP